MKFVLFSALFLAIAESLSCFDCIMQGSVYCVQDPRALSSPQKGVCCESTCKERSSPGWTCSSGFNDQLLSLLVCPVDTKVCGRDSTINLNNSLSLGMSAGDLCIYRSRAQCRIPAVMVDSTSPLTQVHTIGYDDADIGAQLPWFSQKFPLPPRHQVLNQSLHVFANQRP